MPPVKPLEEIKEELAEIKKETPVAEESDSNEFADLVDEMDADDEVVDFGLEEATPEAEGEEAEEEVPSEDEVPAGKEPPLAAETTDQPTEVKEVPTEEPAPVEVAAAPEPEVQTTESEPTPEVKAKEPEPDKSYETLRAEAIVELQKDFVISDEDAQTLVTEPEKVLPKLGAEIYMMAYENAVKSINAALPQMINSTILHQSAMDQATNTFYTKWGKLDRNNTAHSAAVNRIGMTYRQVNPNASQEQFIAEVGAQALLALGIPFAEIVDAPPAEEVTPFVPASPSGTAPVERAAKPMGAFESLAEEFIDDDS